MWDRCRNSNNPYWDRYGGRGICVCVRWRSFTNFMEDMGPRPVGRTLGRIETDEGYYPDNCEWQTPTQQNRNLSSNVLLTFQDRTQCVSAWAEELGIPRARIEGRIRRGWSVEQALTANSRQLTRPERLLRSRAKSAVKRAIAKGTLQRPRRCEKCRRIREVQAHHTDYAPESFLRVQWLCVECHGKAGKRRHKLETVA